MRKSPYSVQSVYEGLRTSLHRYIEAQYHIWDESLIAERRRLLEGSDSTAQSPFIEATPFYTLGVEYSKMDIPKVAAETLTKCADMGAPGVYTKPFRHQQLALEEVLGKGNEIIVATGTGSGKTESFLLPLLGSLAMESSLRPKSASLKGCRALLLYPMNALVNDQLSRLRRLFGDERVASLLAGERGRLFKFGVYTSRTPYAGTHSVAHDRKKLMPIFDKLYRATSEKNKAKLKQEGMWPAKDMDAFYARKFETGPEDRELFTRVEMQKSCPDILVTNYSMLEYMLMRPIERDLFSQTEAWLREDPANKLTVVLDEAHIYRGATGAEVALLLRRLQSRLQVSRDRLRYILTSASLGDTEEAKDAVVKFAANLTGHTSNTTPFTLITGERDIPINGRPASKNETELLSQFDFSILQEISQSWAEVAAKTSDLFRTLNLESLDPLIEEKEALQDAVFSKLTMFAPALLLTKTITGSATRFDLVATDIFPHGKIGESALDSLLALSTFAKRKSDKRVFLPTRLHLFFRGLSGVYACINPLCPERVQDQKTNLLGRQFAEPQERCSCGGRVYEVLTHFYCGAAYIRGYMRGQDGTFLWHEPGVLSQKGDPALLEAHLLVEPRRAQLSTPPHAWLHIETGQIFPEDPRSDKFLPVCMPTAVIDIKGQEIFSFKKECPVCTKGWRVGTTKIMDLATKGDAPFAHLIESQVRLQPAATEETATSPNGGRKSLIFSDGRQRAANLARDIPREVEQDIFRQVLVLAVPELVKATKSARLEYGRIYPAFLHVLSKLNLLLFDGEDRDELAKHIREYRHEEFVDLEEAIANFSRPPPLRFREQLLRQLGNAFYSLNALTIAFVKPTDRAMRQVEGALAKYGLTPDDVESITVNWIQELFDQMGFDENLTPIIRSVAAGYWSPAWGVAEGKPKRRLQRIEEVFGNAAAIDKDLLQILASPKNREYFMKPDKLQIELALDRNWYQCSKCMTLTLHPYRGQCPNCKSTSLAELDPEKSRYLSARKTFWRDPVIRMLAGVDRPFNISVEEHTAQLGYRDTDEFDSTTEKFERRFRDILLDEETETPIDVLSSTTTMEVGIDIGSLIAVGLRNIPPMRQNYQQRAGRAGRRGSSISTVVTYAQNSPHDNHYFTHPEEIIAGDPPLPAIDIANPRIVERHVNAALLQAFFHAQTHDMSPSGDLFTVLGLTVDFYSGAGEFSFGAFQKWIHDSLEGEEAIERIQSWLPAGGLQSAAVLAESFIRGIQNARPTGAEVESKLLDHFFAKGLFPTYAFPRDICALQIETVEPDPNWGGQRRVKILERPQQGMNIALSEYSPERLVVVNKKTYRIGAVAANMPSNELDRAAPLFERARKLVHCEDCLYVQGHAGVIISTSICPFCKGTNVHAMDVIQPEYVYPKGGKPVRELDDERVYTAVTSAQLPIPEGDDGFEWQHFGACGDLVHAPAQSLIMVNKGKEQGLSHTGFAVCVKCGSASLQGNAPDGAHSRHYSVNPITQSNDTCSGIFRHVYLGYTFLSDIVILRIPLKAPLNLSVSDPYIRRPLESAINSLAQAISLAACYNLQIDSRELSSGVRFLKVGEELAADIFLYDTSSGGAGYSDMAGHQFGAVFKKAKEILSKCTCDTSCHKCLRHYGNRQSHSILNRLLALDVWEYVESGKAPSLPDFPSQRKALTPLVTALGLEGWHITAGEDVPFVCEKSGLKRALASYPSILDPMAAAHPNRHHALLFSNFELQTNLPSAFSRVNK